MHDCEMFAFVGPCLFGTEPLVPVGAHLLPPARRGDVEELVAANDRPQSIALIDMDLNRPPAVTYGELREAMRCGWRIWGLAGLGAARAYELREDGMRGYGRVYRHFLHREDFRDDEITFLYEPEPPYRALSEPLVHLRESISWLVKKKSLNAARGREVAKALEGEWLGHRTIDALIALARSPRCGLSESDIRDLQYGFDRFRLQRSDVTRFFAERPWRRLQRIAPRDRDVANVLTGPPCRSVER